MGESMMNRRAAIALAIGSGVGAIQGCRRDGKLSTTKEDQKMALPKKEREGQNLVPVEVDPSLEIRTIAGLRPFRSPGFVVRREERNGKILIHDYGHGGGGMTLSWGTSELAVRMAGDVSGKECAVIGGGVMGLSTARLLQLRGAMVTLYAKALPPQTTSNVAGAQWWPFSVFDDSRRTPEFEAQYVEAANISYRQHQLMVGPKWGIRWLPNYYLSDGPPLNGWISGPGGVLHDLQVGFHDFGPGEHVFPAAYARRFQTMMIEPSIYLPQLLSEVQGAGARIELREFATADEIAALPDGILFNCTGLGAGKLFGDREVVPIKGQLSFLIPQPQVDYNLITNMNYMFPRTDGILLGGTYEKGKWDTTPDEAAKLRMIESHRQLFEGMKRIQAEG
jgi:D-amino-acid oxidase